MTYLVCFDVSDDKVRRNLVKVLETYGRRIQYSIFELYLSSAQYRKLDMELKKVGLDLRIDKCYLYPLSEVCMSHAKYMGIYKSLERVYVF